MPSQYAEYPVTGGGGGGVSSLNSLSGALSLVAGSGITITPSGSMITIASSGGGGGANTALSNLVAPTAVNEPLNDTTAVLSLDLTARQLSDSSALLSVVYSVRQLSDS